MNSDPEARIILDFLHFDLESGTSCDYDLVKIFDGNSTKATQIGRTYGYCGKRAPPVITIASSGNSLLIVFVSNEENTKSGVNATYRGTIDLIYLIPIISCVANGGHHRLTFNHIQATPKVTVD